MSAYKVPLHRVFEICKTRFYLPQCIRIRLNKRNVLKTPHIQICCRCGYIIAPH